MNSQNENLATKEMFDRDAFLQNIQGEMFYLDPAMSEQIEA